MKTVGLVLHYPSVYMPLFHIFHQSQSRLWHVFDVNLMLLKMDSTAMKVVIKVLDPKVVTLGPKVVMRIMRIVKIMTGLLVKIALIMSL